MRKYVYCSLIDNLTYYCRYKKPTALPAPRYIELLIDWIESQINNETIFPVSMGKEKLYSCTTLYSLSFQS